MQPRRRRVSDPVSIRSSDDLLDDYLLETYHDRIAVDPHRLGARMAMLAIAVGMQGR